MLPAAAPFTQQEERTEPVFPGPLKLIFQNKAEESRRLAGAFKEFATRHDLPKSITLGVGLALEELFTNIISYGYGDRESHSIEMDFDVSERKLVIEIVDDGKAFDPTQHPEPNIELSLDDKPIGGLGILMARKSTDEISYSRTNGHNILRLIKQLPT